MNVVLRRSFAVAAFGWAAALPLATWIASRPNARVVPYSFAFTVYGLGAWICHQRPDRSFHLWTMQMPVCARCTGIYVGAAIATLTTYVARGRALLVAAALPTVLTLAFEWATGIAPSNVLRALAGVPLGAALVWLALQAEVN